MHWFARHPCGAILLGIAAFFLPLLVRLLVLLFAGKVISCVYVPALTLTQIMRFGRLRQGCVHFLRRREAHRPASSGQHTKRKR